MDSPDTTGAHAARRAAFIITSHTDVSLLERLVRILLSEADLHVYISHDEAGEDGVERLASERCHVVRDRGGRGDFTQLERVLGLLRRVELDGGADYVTLLSGQDYPARPVRELVAAAYDSGDGFLHHFRALDSTGDWSLHEARQRYLYRWRVLWHVSPRSQSRWHWLHGLNYVQPLLRVNLSYGSFRIGRYRGRLPEGITCYGGSAWFTISRRAGQYVLAVAEDRPDVMEWGRTSLAPDEAFLQSILVSAGRFRFVNDNGRYIDFADDGFGHPPGARRGGPRSRARLRRVLCAQGRARPIRDPARPPGRTCAAVMAESQGCRRDGGVVDTRGRRARCRSHCC